MRCRRVDLCHLPLVRFTLELCSCTALAETSRSSSSSSSSSSSRTREKRTFRWFPLAPNKFVTISSARSCPRSTFGWPRSFHMACSSGSRQASGVSGSLESVARLFPSSPLLEIWLVLISWEPLRSSDLLTLRCLSPAISISRAPVCIRRTERELEFFLRG